MTQIYRPDLKIVDLLRSSKFTISAEVIPPRNGTPQSDILSQIENLTLSGAEFLSVTKGAGGSLRGGSLPIAQVIKDHFSVPSIAHFTCRDLTPEECENQLMDHHYFGIRNILALRGDPPVGVKDWTPHPRSYPYAFQLMHQIRNLNQGQFLAREGYRSQIHSKTDFCIGAAAYPEEAEARARLDFFLLKVEAGAEYAITQMLYDPEAYSKFIDELDQRGCRIPILPGARILKSRAQAIRMQERFGIFVPRSILQELPEDENPVQALQVFMDLVQEFRRRGAPGVHVFVLSDTVLASQAIGCMRT
ncbi:MAG: methylenetetrahydrofolate reductase [Bdellovibrio sp.]